MDENGTKTPTNYNSNGLCNTRIIMDSSGNEFRMTSKSNIICHSELVSTTVPNNLAIKKQDAAIICCLSYNKVVETIK